MVVLLPSNAPVSGPGAGEPGSRAVSETHWWVTVSESAAASEWGAALVEAVFPTQWGPKQNPAS